MPKSKNNRKNRNHKKKVAAFKDRTKQQQNAFKKKYVEMMNAQQQSEIDAKLAEQQEQEGNDVVNIDGIDMDDMKID